MASWPREGQITPANSPLLNPFRNRASQADYVTDQLQLRQYELQLQRAVNQVRVDVKTALISDATIDSTMYSRTVFARPE